MNMSVDKVKKVVIAIDYNPTAQKVAEVGFLIAKAMNAEIVLLHVISDFVYYSSTEYSPIMGFNGFLDLSPMRLESTDGLKQAALNFLDKTRQHLGDNSIKTLVNEGDFADSILKSAKELHADIIILGSHSRKWLENILMGSVTEKVLRHTPIPLFIIPTKRQD
jgi:nucleotide-binding universal stress UspA family protein